MLEIPVIIITLDTDNVDAVTAELKSITTGNIYTLDAIKENDFTGCAKSHIKALNFMRKLNSKYVIICEDSWKCNNPKKLIKSFNHLVNDIPEFHDCKVSQYSNTKSYPLTKYYGKYHYGWIDRFHIVNKNFIDEIIDIYTKALDYYSPIDEYATFDKINEWYVLYPYTIYCVPHYSNIKNIYNNFPIEHHINDQEVLLHNIPTIIIGESDIYNDYFTNIINIDTLENAILYAKINNFYKCLIITNNVEFQDFHKTEEYIFRFLKYHHSYNLITLTHYEPILTDILQYHCNCAKLFGNLNLDAFIIHSNFYDEFIKLNYKNIKNYNIYSILPTLVYTIKNKEKIYENQNKINELYNVC